MKALADIKAEVAEVIAEACRKAGRDSRDVEVIAVTKTHGPEVVREAYEAGFRKMGENRVQEAAWKIPQVGTGPEWHLIGRLQRNKVRAAMGLFDWFHAIDSEAVIERMGRIAEEEGLQAHILLEVNMSGERSKGGFKPDEVARVLEKAMSVRGLWVEGFMTMAPFTPAEKIEETRPVFAGLRELRDKMATTFGAGFPHLSMGMTNDYRIAVEEGATWVRLGTVLFGERPKLKMGGAVGEGTGDDIIKVMD